MKNFLEKMNLKTKAVLFIALTLVFVIGLATSILTRGFTPKLEQALVMNSTLVGENLIKDIKKTIDLGISITELEGLSGKLTELTDQYAGLDYIYVTDADGDILYQNEDMPKGAISDAGKSGSSADSKEVSTIKIKAGGTEYYDISIPIISSDTLFGMVHIGLRSEVVSSQIEPIRNRSLLIGLVTFLLASGALIMFVTRTISQPLENLSDTARKISSGKLSVPEKADRKDEIGQLSRAFRVMVSNLSSMVSQSRDSSDSLEKSANDLSAVSSGLSEAFSQQITSLDEVIEYVKEMDRLSHDLSERARELSDSASDSSTSIIETTSAIGEINRNMAQITSSVEDISASILEMSTTVRQVAGGAEDTASMAEETKDAIGRINNGIQNIEDLAEKSLGLSDTLRKNAADIGSRAMKETLQGIHSIQDDVTQAETAMKGLQERVGDIGEIITVIDEIADQTNLLALNASIISAQAGEHGRSFAVVANEIRELSIRTADSIKKISSLIKSVQEESNNYSNHINRVIQSVVKGLKLGQEAEKALEKIVDSADESAKMANLIAEATKEQAEASNQVSNSVEIFTQRAEETKRATLEEAKGSEFIKESMENAKEMIEMVYKATAEQNRGSQLISETSEKSRSIAEELFQAMEKERQLSNSISQAIDALKSISHENFELAKNINSSAEMLTGLSSSLKDKLGAFQVDQTGLEEPTAIEEKDQ